MTSFKTTIAAAAIAFAAATSSAAALSPTPPEQPDNRKSANYDNAIDRKSPNDAITPGMREAARRAEKQEQRSQRGGAEDRSAQKQNLACLVLDICK